MGGRVFMLDLIRTTAIVLVVLCHYRHTAFPNGSIGVAIFFSLSGYLITKVLLNDKITTTEFIIRRFFRIFPAYFIVIILNLMSILYFVPGKFQTVIDGWIYCLFFIKMPSEWLGMGIGIFWTLQIEMYFYLFAPFIIRNVFPRFGFRGLFVLIAVALVAKSIAIIWFNAEIQISIAATLVYADTLLYGAIAAIVLDRRVPLRGAVSLALAPHRAWIVVGGLVFLPLGLAMIDVPVIFAPIEYSVISMMTSLAIVISQRHGICAAWNNAAVAMTSSLAYCTYLCHPFIMDYADGIKQAAAHYGVPFMAFGGMLTLLLIVGLYYGVEGPGIALGRIMAKRFSNR